MNNELSPARRWAALAVLVGAVLLLAIDATVLYLAVPSLTADLAPTSEQVLWIGDIYSLALAGLLVTMGNLADRIGRKRLLLIGAGAFGLASVLAAFSPNPETLIAARLLLGVAGATIMPSTLSLIRNIFTDPLERTRAIAIWSAAAASGIALGPLLGGALLEFFWWGSVFLINLPVMLVVLIVGSRLLPESKKANPGPFDLTSSALSMVAIIPFVYLIKKLAGGTFDATTIAAAVISVIAAVAFVRRQRRVESPMIDVTLFANRTFSGAIVVNFISIFALVGFLFLFSQYLQLARGLSPLQAGLAQAPVAVSAVVVVAVVGFLLTRLGRGRAIALALAFGAIGLLAVAAVESSDQMLWLLVALVPIGLGIGVAEALSVDAVVSAVPAEGAGAASSIAETAYELGVAFGIAVLGSMIAVFYRLNVTLPADIQGDTLTRAEDSLAGAAAVLPADGAAFDSAREAFVSAMQVTTAFAAVTMVVASVLAARLIPNTKTTAPVSH